MFRATLLFVAAFLLIIFSSPLSSQSILYVGNTRVDLDFGHNNEPGVDKVEIYRDNVKLGEMINGGSGLVYYADKGLNKGTKYYYSAKKYKSDNSTQTVGIGFLTTGEVRGYLLSDEKWDTETTIMDSVVVILGTLHIADGAKIIPGTKQIQTKVNVGVAAGFKTSGGSIQLVNIDCFGQFNPIINFTMIGANIFLHGNFPTFLEGCVLQEVPSDKTPVYLYSPNFAMEAHKVTVRGASELRGAALAESCIVESYSSITGTIIRNSWIKTDAFIALRPNDVQTVCEYNRFDTSQVGLAQQSLVQYNKFTGPASVLVSAASAGFPISEVSEIHINYNEFLKIGGDVSFLSNVDADSIDARKNYWGDTNGPDAQQRMTKAFFDPFLRVPYPKPAFWLDINPDKEIIVANNQDRVTFNGQMSEVLSGNVTADTLVTYQAICLGETFAQDSVRTGPDGKMSFFITLPNKYSNANSVIVRVLSIQGIRYTFIILVGTASGPDLTIDNVQVVQIQGAVQGLIADQPFAVRVDITTSDVVTDYFQVAVKINGKTYTRFYRFARQNITLDYGLRDYEDSLRLPNGESLTLYFFPNVSDLHAGTHTIDVTIDLPDPSHPYGMVTESNEDNNTRSIQIAAKDFLWGNESGSANLSVLFQPFEFEVTSLGRFNTWCDSAMNFMRKVWPMLPSQLQVTKATDVLNPSPEISPKTFLDSTFESYLVKAYKLVRKNKPNFDRYVLSVNDGWFFTRIDRWEFENTLSTAISYSGIPDLVVSRVHHFKSPIHELGHTFGLRRYDYGLDEEYHLYNIGKQVIDGIDCSNRGLKEYGLLGPGNSSQEVICFMSNSLLNFGRQYWICDEDYTELFNNVRQHLQAKEQFAAVNSTSSAAEAMLITGTIDSSSNMTFGVWDKLQNATLSPMSDSASSAYVFKVLDAAGKTLARYFYRPTFTALGFDEGPTPPPVLRQEHFAFVVPFPAGAEKISVYRGTIEIISRSKTANAPTVQILSPSKKDEVLNQDFSFKWQGSDTDGGTLFYTIYLSNDEGSTWKMLAMDITDDSLSYLITKFAQGRYYKLRVVVSDGILTGSAESEKFTIDNEVSVDKIKSPLNFELKQNFPNPFSASTIIYYELLTTSQITLDIIDALGRTVQTITDAIAEPGRYSYRFDGSNLRNGIYFVRLRNGEYAQMKKMILSK